jgi:hypothetical protein
MRLENPGSIWLPMGEHAEFVIQATDYEGTPVVLTRSTWYAKAGEDRPGAHPEIRDYLEDIAAAIASPDLVFQSTRDERSRVFYRLRAGRDDFASKHLVIIVKYVQEASDRRGYVSTMYLSRAVYTQGVLLWPRTGNVPR